ncbi:MAG TPA: hypothetical protein VFF36_08895 [Planctomycetota bacterium]|jgi:hypothetical protein|nr:hypothetical protein [Planctomycetota bacterium]
MTRLSTSPGIGAEGNHEQDGTTCIDDCCTFRWIQRGALRSVLVDENHHYACVQSLLAAERSGGVVIRLLHATRPGGRAAVRSTR